MISLAKKSLPDTVNIDGRDYFIQTDFRFWLRFAELTADKKTPPADLMFIFPYEKPPSVLNAIAALFEFYNPKQELPRSAGNETGERALDYVIDEDLIYCAFMQQYGIDLKEVDLHWWKFQTLMRGLLDTKLNEIISYRLYTHTGKPDAYSREMERLKRAWALPEETDDKELREFNAMFE